MVLIVFGLLAVLSIGFASVCYVVIDNPELIAPPPPLRTANSPAEYVIGDLGGMPVKIDHRIVRFIEYDGDPGWGEMRRGPRPQRTYSSRLKSFAFEVRYPDMKTRADKDAQVDYEKYHPLFSSLRPEFRDTNPWFDGGIDAGDRYPGHGSLDRLYQGTILNPDQQPISAQLLPEPSLVSGLELYAPRGRNPATGNPWRFESSWGDTYIHRNHLGKVTAYIQCAYRLGTRRYSECTHHWNMEQFDLDISVDIYYPATYLPEWRDIQERVSYFLLSFRSSPDGGKTLAP
jgi:hypothetical protein